jgi:hypothetical protein
MSHQRDESAKWGQAVNEVMGEWEGIARKLLSESAARGFPAPDGVTLDDLQIMTLKAQGELVKANAKIYQEQRQIIFELEGLSLKVAIEVAKLALDWYKAQLLNDLALEQAEQDANIEKWRGDVIRLNAETENRQAAIIRLKADIEHEVNLYKQQEIQAEYLTLQAEVDLVNAKVATAEAKLAIIGSLYDVIAAEQLALYAEQRRAAALQLVVAAKKRLADVKKEMIPLYLKKAEAREDLAEATTKEAAVKEQIELLGYDRIKLKDAEEEADHEVREAENDFQLAQEQYTRWEKIVEILRTQQRRILQQYANDVRREILARQLALRKEDLEIDFSTTFQRRQMEANADIALMGYEKLLSKQEFLNRMKNLKEIGVDNASTIEASATQTLHSSTWTVYAKRVSKGSANIS